MKAERSEDKDLEYFHEIVKTILICVLIGVIGFTYLRELLKIEEIEKAKVRNEKIVFDDDVQSQNVRVIRGTSQ